MKPSSHNSSRRRPRKQSRSLQRKRTKRKRTKRNPILREKSPSLSTKTNLKMKISNPAM